MATDIAKPRVLVVGWGYVGMYAALRLQKKLSPGEATITVGGSPRSIPPKGKRSSFPTTCW